MVNMTTTPPPDQAATPATRPDQPYPELSNRAIFWSAVVLLVLGVGLAVWLLLAFGDGKHTDKLDAIKTAGTIVVGTGGAAALWLTARRQRSNEIALNQKRIDQQVADRAFTLQQQVADHNRAVSEQNRIHQERVAAATEADAEARRITELYTKAVEQLGSDKAPVRLGGLYALERLAQDNPAQRQTIVNVLCAYLRMPYTPLNDPAPSKSAPAPISAEFEQNIQERQVRLAAQHILATHLRRDAGHDKIPDTLWPNIDVDLADATLIDINFKECVFRKTSWERAIFTGSCRFDGATFLREATFEAATFLSEVRFTKTTFNEDANFINTSFLGESVFSGSIFKNDAEFNKSIFTEESWFGGVMFDVGAWFPGTKFASVAHFNGAVFYGSVSFHDISLTKHILTGSSDKRVDNSCLVRTDAGNETTRTWPTDWTVVPTNDRPTRNPEGEWGHITRTSGQ